jgi:SAM-dependent methyltransferase
MAATQLYDLILAPLRFRAVLALVELRVVDLLERGPSTAAEIASELGCSAEPLGNLLAIGQTLGIMEQVGGALCLSRDGMSFFTDAAGHNLEPLFRYAAKHIEPVWRHLSDGVREGGAQWHKEFPDIPPLGRIYSDDEELLLYQKALHSLAFLEGRECARRIAWDGRKTVLDVGGGTGGLCLALLERHRQLRAICLDLPEVCQIGKKILAAARDAERIEFLEGDMFSMPFPHPVDAIVLSMICNRDPRTDCLLEKCVSSLGKDGILIIGEKTRSSRGCDTFDLLRLNALLTADGGVDCGGSEFAAKLHSVGCAVVAVVETSGWRDFVVAVKRIECPTADRLMNGR